MSKKNKAKIASFAKANPERTAMEIKKHFYPLTKDISTRTIQKWKKIEESKIEEWKTEDTKRDRKALSLFPTIEGIILDIRQKKVDNTRDHSADTLHRELQKILNDKDYLDTLPLNEYERNNIDKFEGSMGFIRKLMKRNGLVKKKIKSDRKLTIKEYVIRRKDYLKGVRERLREYGVIRSVNGNEEWDKARVMNIDEVPLVLAKIAKKQVCKPDERTQIRKPPITGHDKYRDATLVPLVSGTKPIFLVVLVKGVESVSKREMPILQRKYGRDGMICLANKKGYVYVFYFICLFYFCLFYFYL